MSTYQFNWDDTREVAHKVARKVAKEYPGISAEDVEQEVLLEVLKREDMFKRMNYEIPQLWRFLTNYARKYSNDERLAVYQWDSQYHYTTKEVRALCAEALFDRDAFYDKVERDVNLMTEFEEIMCRVADLQAAYAKLREQDQNVIYRRYVIGESLSPADAKRLERATNHLAIVINKGKSIRKVPKDHDGPGARKAISNAHARFITENQDRGGSLIHHLSAW